MAGKVNPLALAKQLTHQQRVTRLYRVCSRHLLSWTRDRKAWREQAVILRDKFDENKDLKDQFKIESILQKAEAEFKKYQHPQPYIHPKAPGGTKYERNVPPPPNALQMLPIEEEWYNEMLDWANGKD